MNLSRIRRLLRLIHLLQGGKAYNTEALAQSCSVSRRTVFRDLCLLRDAGVPLVYERLLQAVTDRRSVRIRYRSLAEEEVICTRLHPYRLLFSRRSWYVIGRSSLHRATRTFNVGRILALDVLEDRYEVPRGFSVDRYLGNAWHLIPEPGPDREVVIRFAKRVAQNVGEVAWHRTQRLEFRPDGSLDFHVTVSGLGEISWWVLGYGDQAEVLQPPELRRIVAGHAARMMQKYAEGLGVGGEGSGVGSSGSEVRGNSVELASRRSVGGKAS